MREPENVVGTKKNKKETKKTLSLECNQTACKVFQVFMNKDLLQLPRDTVGERQTITDILYSIVEQPCIKL